LLAAGATEVFDRPPPAHATQVLAPPEPERRSPWVPVAVTLVLVGLLGLLLWFIATNLLGGDDQQTGVLVTVPGVVGERLNTARTLLEEAGLVVVDENIVHEPAPANDPEAEPGTVLAQDPPGGEEVEEGTEVILTVVAQPEAIPIPTVVGLEASAAQLILGQAGFVVVQEQEASEDIDEGDVIRTEPPEGTEALPGDTVTIVVSTGSGLVIVPEVTCQSFGQAQGDLRDVGLVPVRSTETVAINPLCPNGNKVHAQDPTAGSEVPAGTTVFLFAGEVVIPTGPTGPTG